MSDETAHPKGHELDPIDGLDPDANSAVALGAIADIRAAITKRFKRKGRNTAMGTPCANAWDDDWVAAVDAKEAELDRRICGARTMAATPCTLASDHDSGRCRFHGGFDLTGAPKGNRNAVIHGLYSRRLRSCSTQCPMWHACPLANPEVAQLDPKERPSCPYEQAEYNATLTDGLAVVEQSGRMNALDKHTVHAVALLQVLMTRATLALADQPMEKRNTSSSDQYDKQTVTVNPVLQAFLRIAGEYRHYRRLLEHPESRPTTRIATDAPMPTVESVARQRERAQFDTNLDPDAQQDMHVPDFPMTDHALHLMDRAVLHAAKGEDVAAMEAYKRATLLNGGLLDFGGDRMLDAYRPNGKPLPDDPMKEFMERFLNLSDYDENGKFIGEEESDDDTSELDDAQEDDPP